jgi:hypothetical protein
MKYALLGYDLDRSLEVLAGPEKRALHGGHAALHEAQNTEGAVTVVAHYRFRPPQQATTVRLEDGELVRGDGPASETSGGLRALYLVESDDLDAVVELAGRLPAVGAGATVEIWPLTEPRHD